MRRATIFAIGLSLLGLVPGPAQARETYSGINMLINCTTNAVICDTYFSGLLDAYVAIQGWADTPPIFCIVGPSNGHLIWPLVVADLGEARVERPDILEFSAASLIIGSLRRLYPCEEGQPAVAEPAFLTGLELVGLCRDTGLCEAYLISVLEAHRTLVDWGTLTAPYVCLPDEVENNELMLSLLTYLGGRQDQLSDYSGGTLTIVALSESYDCGP